MDSSAAGRGGALSSVDGGRYQLGEVLGTGGAATVYSAVDAVLEVPRAVKVLRLDHDAIRERFLAEARVLARLRHPNLLRVVDYGEDDGRPWIVTEIAVGGNLAERLGHGALSPVDAISVSLEVLAGLLALHVQGFVHRDVKPSNVLFGVDDEVWLSDLGVLLGSDAVVSRRHRTSGAIGTAGYRSPEMRSRPSDVGPEADLYGVGALLFAALTARPPPDLALVDLSPRVLNRVPESLREVIRRATRYQPEQRYPTALAMAEDLARVRCELDPTAPSVEATLDELSRRSRRSLPDRPSLPPSAVPVPPRVEGPPQQTSVLVFVIVVVIGGIASTLLAGLVYLLLT